MTVISGWVHIHSISLFYNIVRWIRGAKPPNATKTDSGTSYNTFMNALYRRFKPGIELASFVEYYYEFNDHGIFRGQPVRTFNDGVTEMIIHLADPTEFFNCTRQVRNSHKMALTGQYLDDIITTPTGHTHIITVNFKPGGMYAIFGIPQYYFRSDNISLLDIDPVGGSELFERLMEQDSIEKRIGCIEQYLIHVSRRNYTPVIEMYYATAMIRKSMGCKSIHAISEDFGMSARSFNRRFRDQVGISPKQFSEIVRLNYVCNDLINNKESDLYSLSVKYGYYDPSHLINAVKRYLYVTPKELLNNMLSGGDYLGKITIVPTL